MASSSSLARPFKLAIIGGGPSGFYAASRVLSKLPTTSPEGRNAEIHVYERLPCPHGLVRFGVAPDHPEVKNVQNKFDSLHEDYRFKYFGNVCIGNSNYGIPEPSYSYPHALHLPLSALFPYYTHLVFSYGASLSSPLPILGSTASEAPLKNVHTALSLVGWYNGHPAYSDASFAPNLSAIEHATVIGQGNVALDVARILLKGKEGLKSTDVPEAVLAVLQSSRVKEVEVVGRRGPGQVAFTTKEFREQLALEDVRFGGVDVKLIADAKEENDRVGGDQKRARTRLLGLMEKGNAEKAAAATKQFNLGFLRSPKSFNSSSTGTERVQSVTWSINNLLPPPLPASNPPIQAPAEQSPITVAVPTGEEVTVDTEMVVESVGYRSEGISGAESDFVFDQSKGRIRNSAGRMVDSSGVIIPNMYSTGWVSRGPIGVIASTMVDAYSTMDLLLEDHLSSHSSSTATKLALEPPPGAPNAIKDSTTRIISYSDWLEIDKEEKRIGAELGKPREKFTRVEDMLNVLD